MKKSFKCSIAVYFLLLVGNNLQAQNTNFSSGSFIINMGVIPQTITNGLKPYGMVYDLVKNYDVPVYWAINPNKLKDGIDFSLNGTDYRGGTFIIAAENRTAAVDSRIIYWQSLGVVGSYSISSFIAPIAQKITAVPRWTLDQKTGQIAVVYLDNAGIPSTNSNWTDPLMLDNCNDIFVLPHADPKWSTHGNLLAWNGTYKGAIWASCHAVSVLENMVNPAAPAQQTNFLANNSGGPGSQALVPFGSHKDGTLPYNDNSYATDPVMQFMGIIDGSTNNGSESIYLPALGGGWRPSTKVGVYDPSHPDVPALSAGKAAALAWGRGFGDSNRGWVMYEAGHSQNKGTEAELVAAQRAFFNFSFMAALVKTMDITVSGIQNVMVSKNLYSFSATITQAIPSGPYTAQWSSTCGGTFSNPTSLSTSFTPDSVGPPTSCVISLKVSDACGRTRFFTQNITIVNQARPPVTQPDTLTFSPNCINLNPIIKVYPLGNDIEPDGQPMTLSSITGSNGTWTINPDQSVSFKPNEGFYGTTTATYSVCDNTSPSPLCISQQIVISIGSASLAPTAGNDSYTILEDSIQRFNVLSNDAGGSLTVSGIPVLPLNGYVSINMDNTITYLPKADFHGVDSFTYQIVNPSGYSATARVLVNSLADGCALGNYKRCSFSSGTISLIASEDTYLGLKFPTTVNGAAGLLVIDREATDLQRTLVKFNLPALSCDPSVSPVITAANLKLYKLGGNNGGQPLNVHRITNSWTQNDATWNQKISGSNWTTPGGDFNSTVEATVTSGPDGPFSWSITSLVSNWYNNASAYPNYGVLLKTVEGGGNKDPNFISTESTTSYMKPTLEITYTIPLQCFAIPSRPPLGLPDTATTNSLTAVILNVTGNDVFVTAGPITVSILPGSVSSGTALISGNNIIYTPVASFAGTASFQYITRNTSTSLSDTSTAYIFVSYAAPVANDDYTSVFSGNTVATNITANDIDPQSIGIIPSIISGASHGTYSLAGNIISYTAPFNFVGKDTIYYRLSNAISGLCNETNAADTAMLVITVNNRPPVAQPDASATNPCMQIVLDVMENDSDPENGVITIASLSSPLPAGSGTVSTDGTYIYFIPNPAFSGATSSFTYTIQDDAAPPLTSSPATVTISFSNFPNQAPIPKNDTLECVAANSIFWNLLNNDMDPDGDSVFISLGGGLKTPAHGTVSMVNNYGLIQYTPDPWYKGVDSFEYRLCDVHFDNSGGSCGMHSDCKVATAYIFTADLFGILANNSISLSVSKINKQHLIKWKMVEDKNITSYYIDRSADGIFYNVISTKNIQKPANGMSMEYSFLDALPLNGMNYYRLRIVRGNQPIQYSKIVAISGSSNDTWRVIGPVPFSNQIKIEGNLSKHGKSEIQIFDANSHLVKYYRVQVNAGYNSIRLTDLSTLPAGFYIINISGEGQVFRQKITKID
jgi:hypothetical protein